MCKSLVKPGWAGACFQTLQPGRGVGQGLESGGLHVSISVLSLAPSPTISLSLSLSFSFLSLVLSLLLSAPLFAYLCFTLICLSLPDSPISLLLCFSLPPTP